MMKWQPILLKILEYTLRAQKRQDTIVYKTLPEKKSLIYCVQQMFLLMKA